MNEWGMEKASRGGWIKGEWLFGTSERQREHTGSEHGWRPQARPDLIPSPCPARPCPPFRQTADLTAAASVLDLMGSLIGSNMEGNTHVHSAGAV